MIFKTDEYWVSNLLLNEVSFLYTPYLKITYLY